MAMREIIKIDEDKCNGCGKCVPSCAEGAIQIIDGKAKLVAENLCDGLGACLGDCPEGAMTIEKRNVDEFDEKAVEVQLKKLNETENNQIKISHAPHGHGGGGGCPGSRTLSYDDDKPASDTQGTTGSVASELRQWPTQLHLVSPMAPYFQEADLLLAADCVPFAMGNFHATLLKGKGLANACPKLDSNMEIYVQKLTAMIDDAKINTITVVVMEVPCCTGLVAMAKQAQEAASRSIPVKRVVVGLKGDVLSEDWI